MFVVIIERVAADVRALVADEDALVAVRGEPLGDCGAGKAGADDEVIEHHVLQAPSRGLDAAVAPTAGDDG